ncbi:MAG TPA: alpha-L-arabinofuranosidase C-terminal domain-containing protein [Acidobacteriaceae bacterium]|nr:alpha-L-arabinofuranosidase C-terminal domain-containing protein [Acidobacteriaceae bacterium]
MKFRASAAISALIAMAAGAACAQSKPAVLTIHPDQPVAIVSPTLYGLMTEEINHAYDGGLYAEMVNNRDFHADWGGILDWYLVEKGDSEAKISVDRTSGPSEALPQSLKLEVSKASAESPAGVLNTGYWGMAVRGNTAYHGSFYAKGDSIGTITVALVANQSGRVLASATVTGVGTDWRQYTFTLKTGAVEPSEADHLSITVAQPGSLWLCLASLFPPTYHDRANGNRIDLMEKLAAMHPAFLRFPGGNYLEGNTMAEWYDWKKTVGPLVDRHGHPSPWGYFSTDGLGLLEFFEWCEDLHMQPVLAVYAGYSLNGEHVEAGPKLEPYVQSALDEIEYATGGPDTKFGAQRIADGHPQPFHITYVEIGNEDQFDRSGSYEGRYAQFYKAIKAKYPDLQLIATRPVTSMKPDVIDDHYYVRATEFFHDATHYDKTDRSGPKIFVGEWATREGTPTPNMGAALGDAAWMTGLERNSDIVVMASYAPLLTNVNPEGLQWTPDLIGYDALRSYGSPSYYAQVMFGSHLGTQRPASSVDGGGSRFFYSVTEDATKKQLYLKLVNASTTPQSLDIDLPGASLAAAAKLTTLSAHSTQATNTIDEPRNIVPVDSEVHTASGKIHVEMPGLSIQVLQIGLK